MKDLMMGTNKSEFVLNSNLSVDAQGVDSHTAFAEAFDTAVGRRIDKRMAAAQLKSTGQLWDDIMHSKISELEYLSEEFVDADHEDAKRDFALFIGSAIAVVGIICITVGVSYFLSMYQTVGWLS